MTMNDQELDRRLAALTTESEPDASLWPAIERRLAPSRSRPAAVAAVSLMLLLLIMTLPRMDQDATETGRLTDTRVHEIPALDPAPQWVARAEQLPALMNAWQDNRQAGAQLEQALENDPGNPLLLEFLGKSRLREARLVQITLSLPQRSTET